jgi:hypothetical protein
MRLELASAVAGAVATAKHGTRDLRAFTPELNAWLHAQQYWSRVLPPGYW